MDRAARKIEQRQRREFDRQTRKAEQQNRQAISKLGRELRRASRPGPSYTPDELLVADRVQEAVALDDQREWDTFLSYAHVDGSDIAAELHAELDNLGVANWFDEESARVGKPFPLEIDNGLTKAHAGIILLTGAYLAGRTWTEKERSVLLDKDTLIPVVHGVTFEKVREFSGMIAVLKGFDTSRDSVAVIEKIAGAVVSSND